MRTRKAIPVLVLLLSLIFSLTPCVARAADDGQEGEAQEQPLWPAGPDISADAAIVVEQTTGLILYEKDIYTAYYPASTTKILTTLLALENSNLNETVTVSYEAEWYVSKASSRMGLVEGEQLSMEEALYGIMLESANEATYAVGEHVFGSVGTFIKQMNIKAAELGCKNSHFANTHGLHDDEHYTCCYDLALISRAAWNNEDFRKITGTRTYVMPETNKNPERVMTNHHNFINKTMKYDYCVGGKTGATAQAGNALVTYAKKDGMTLVAVVMHASSWDRVYADTKTVLDFAFENYDIYDMKDADGEQESTLPSMFSQTEMFAKDKERDLRLGNDGKIILPNGVLPDSVSKEINFYPDITIENGDNVIGDIAYTYNGRVVGKAEIVFTNKEHPLTDKSFKEWWPRYMVPVELVFGEEKGDTTETFEKRLEKKRAAEEQTDYTPVYISIGAAALALGVGGLILKRKLSR
ncbi:MAG: D-alanyl-D-alanine carboxypeptidase [Lachnospiraceae bacterium]|nr:D-alanyl-D-alanine carboxypeptidase [Lachnospiraceae bacterium]